jgi:hypothetical protein
MIALIRHTGQMQKTHPEKLGKAAPSGRRSSYRLETSFSCILEVESPHFASSSVDREYGDNRTTADGAQLRSESGRRP